MAVGDNSSTIEIIINGEEKNTNNAHLSPKKRMKDPGVRVKGGRIYDSENGKTCHQCRQKTRDFAAFCKSTKNDKSCTLTFCHKCLLNRYGEKAEAVGKLEDWMCPRCRGVCNCSFCMKRKGYQPTGILSHTVKATGFNSVQELLHKNSNEVLELRNVVNDSTSSPKKSPLSNKGSVALKRKCDKKNQSVEQNVCESNEDGLAKKEKKGTKRLKYNGSEKAQVSVAVARSPKLIETNVSGKCGDNETNQDKEHADNMKAKALPKGRKPKKLAVKSHIESKKEEIVMPLGKPLTKAGGLELPSQDVGAALQFLEFCDAFSEVLEIKKGQPECILRDLAKRHVKRHKGRSALVQFNIKLLSLIYTDMKKHGDAWLQTLKSCIEDSHCTLEQLPMDFLAKGSFGYDDLKPSQKLKILTFLCDQVLGTEELRNWMDEAEAKFDEGRKKNKEKVVAAREEQKLIKQKAKDEIAKTMLSARGGAPLSLAELDNLLSKIRSEADKVHASLELLPQKHPRSDAVRTDHLMLGSNGQIMWKLSCYNNSSNIIRQDIGNWDSVALHDKWFIYHAEEQAVVEKYISSLRNPTFIKHRSNDAEEEMKPCRPEGPESEDSLPQEEMGA